MAAKTYDPLKYRIYFNGILVEGYADGEFIKLAREVATFTKSTGASGSTTRVKSNNKSATCTVTLQAESPTNSKFSALHLLDEDFNTGKGVFMFKDINGETLASAESAWLVGYPEISGGTEAGSREWMIDMESLKIFVGGGLF